MVHEFNVASGTGGTRHGCDTGRGGLLDAPAALDWLSAVGR